MKIIFLVSGAGGNLKFFFNCIRRGVLKDVELAVVADRECPALEFARRHGLIAEQIQYSRREPQALKKVLRSLQPDVVVTNWHKIIDKETVEEFSGRMINLHYSLLPAFAGLIGIEPIKQAYARGCLYIGPTCHFVENEVDAGRIIFQSVFRSNMPIEAAITKMFREGCVALVFSISKVTRDDLAAHSSIVCGDAMGGAGAVIEGLGNEFWREVESL